jgi:hypothetical protein
MKNMQTFSKGKVAKDPITGRFISVKNMKPMHTKAETAKEAAEPALKVISALYGIEGTRVEMANVKAGKKLNNKMAGSDPAPGTKKNAIIKVEVNGAEVEKTFNEGEVITFE